MNVPVRLEQELQYVGPGAKPFRLFSIAVHHKAASRMSVIVHDVTYGPKYCVSRDLVTIHSLIEER